MYERVIRQALTTPWLITEEMGELICGILRFRAEGGRLDADELRARIGPLARSPHAAPPRGSDGVIAVLPVWGVIANRTFDASSGMTSIEAVRAAFRHAIDDDDVSAIVLDINSPGGTAPGVPEFAAEIFAAREAKPIVAFVDDLMASAAYWIGSQAHEIVAIPTADIGSIGVYILHVSQKAALEQAGLKVTAIQYGENKTKTASWNDLDAQTEAELQQRVDELGRAFDAAVARGRGVTPSVVRERFGQGRVFTAKDAKALGLIDQIGSFDDVIAELAAQPGMWPGRGRRRLSSGRALSQADLDYLDLVQLECDNQ